MPGDQGVPGCVGRGHHVETAESTVTPSLREIHLDVEHGGGVAGWRGTPAVTTCLTLNPGE
jgi:hypothetical protein